MKLIYLAFPLTAHWRWKFAFSLGHTLEKGDDFRTSTLTLPSHCFTHIDTPLHCTPGGAQSLDELPVDTYCGDAVIIDLSFVDAGHSISKEDITKNLPEVREGDIILLKTCWDKKRDILTHEYWSDAPFMSEEATDFIFSLSPKAVGFDFPQDEILRQAATYQGCLPMDKSTTHYGLLMKGVFLIEYLCNLDAIKSTRTTFMALPLNIKGGEGCPVRAVALEL